MVLIKYWVISKRDRLQSYPGHGTKPTQSYTTKLPNWPQKLPSPAVGMGISRVYLLIPIPTAGDGSFCGQFGDGYQQSLSVEFKEVPLNLLQNDNDKTTLDGDGGKKKNNRAAEPTVDIDYAEDCNFDSDNKTRLKDSEHAKPEAAAAGNTQCEIQRGLASNNRGKIDVEIKADSKCGNTQSVGKIASKGTVASAPNPEPKPGNKLDNDKDFGKWSSDDETVCSDETPRRSNATTNTAKSTATNSCKTIHPGAIQGNRKEKMKKAKIKKKSRFESSSSDDEEEIRLLLDLRKAKAKKRSKFSSSSSEDDTSATAKSTTIDSHKLIPTGPLQGSHKEKRKNAKASKKSRFESSSSSDEEEERRRLQIWKASKKNRQYASSSEEEENGKNKAIAEGKE